MTALWADLSKFVKSPFWRYISALGALWHSCATGSWTGKGENQALDRPRLLSGQPSCHYLRSHKHSAHSACYHAPQVKSVQHFGERTFGN